LVPKRARDFRKITIKETGFSENLVNDLLDFYWKRVQSDLSDMTHYNIRVTNIGTFNIKHWKLDEHIEKHEGMIVNMEGKFKKHVIVAELNKQITDIKRIKTLLEGEKVRLHLVKEKRKNDDSNINLEKQAPDLDRSPEQDI
jgi:hypothetical protein